MDQTKACLMCVKTIKPKPAQYAFIHWLKSETFIFIRFVRQHDQPWKILDLGRNRAHPDKIGLILTRCVSSKEETNLNFRLVNVQEQRHSSNGSIPWSCKNVPWRIKILHGVGTSQCPGDFTLLSPVTTRPNISKIELIFPSLPDGNATSTFTGRFSLQRTSNAKFWCFLCFLNKLLNKQCDDRKVNCHSILFVPTIFQMIHFFP